MNGNGANYRIRIAAELSGVSEQLIRQWERRYKILKPKRTPGGFRVYSADDIELLKRLKKMTEQGISILEASKLMPELRREIEEEDPVDAGAQLNLASAPLAQWKDEILEAAEKLDQPHIDAVLDRAFAALPPLQVFESLVVPVEREVGDRWLGGTLGVAEEHLVTEALRLRLISLLHGAPKGGRRHVLCACFPTEVHELGLLGAALRLRYLGHRVTFLGARTPAEELGKVAHSAKPDLVALSCVLDPGVRTFKRELAQLLAALPAESRVLVGGAAAIKHAALIEAHGPRVHAAVNGWQDWVTQLNFKSP